MFGTPNSLDACINFPSQFSQDEFLLFLATSDNRHPHFYNLLDFPVARFTHVTIDNHSIDKSLALHPSGRPYAKHTPQLPSIDTTSDVSLQTHPSSCNVLVYTHKIGNTPSNTPTTNAITTQPSISQIHQTILYLLFNPLLSLLTLSHQLLPPSLFFHLLLNILRQIFK